MEDATDVQCRLLSLRYVTLLLARLMGQYCSARWRLSASVVVVVYNTAGGPAAGRAGGRVTDTARRASRVRPVMATPCFTLNAKSRELK